MSILVVRVVPSWCGSVVENAAYASWPVVPMATALLEIWIGKVAVVPVWVQLPVLTSGVVPTNAPLALVKVSLKTMVLAKTPDDETTSKAQRRAVVRTKMVGCMKFLRDVKNISKRLKK